MTLRIYHNFIHPYLYLCKELAQGSFHEKFHTTHDPMKLEHILRYLLELNNDEFISFIMIANECSLMDFIYKQWIR